MAEAQYKSEVDRETSSQDKAEKGEITRGGVLSFRSGGPNSRSVAGTFGATTMLVDRDSPSEEMGTEADVELPS